MDTYQYQYPPIELFEKSKEESDPNAEDELKANAQKLVDTLESFGVRTRVLDISRGPSVTRYEVQPMAGVKISRITSLADDIALNLAVADVRMEAPIPGKPAVGIEVPNHKRSAEVSRLAAACPEEIRPKSSVRGMQCSLSGLENQCNALLAAGKSPEYVCKYCLLCLADTVVKMTKAAQKEYPGLPVVCAGGVMSSDVIRQWVQKRLPQVYFVPGQYSSDNAIGVSILAAREAGLWLK